MIANCVDQSAVPGGVVYFIDIYLYFTFGLWIVRRGRCKAVLLMNGCFKSTRGWSCTLYPQNKWYYIAWLSCKYYIISQSTPISICFEVSKTAMDAVSESYRHHCNLPDIPLPATASGRTIHEAFPFEYTIAGWILFVNVNAHIEICHLVLHRLQTRVISAYNSNNPMP